MYHPTDRAPMFLRVAAATIDAAVVAVPVGAGVMAWSRLARGVLPRLVSTPLLMTVLVLLPLGYSLLDVTRRGTAGKRLLGLRILRERGKVPSRVILLARWAWKAIPPAVLLSGVSLLMTSRWADRYLSMYVIDAGALLTLVLIVSFFPAGGIERQSFYDVLTETAVYRRPPEPLSRGFEPIVREVRVDAAGGPPEVAEGI